MATPVWITGFEHGVASTNGGGLTGGIVGSASVQGTVKRSGNYALEFDTTGGDAACGFYAPYSPPASETDLVGRFYVRWDTEPSAEETFLYIPLGIGDCYFDYSPATHKIGCYITGVSITWNNEVLSTETWYRVDFHLDVSSNPNIVDFTVAEDGQSGTAAQHSATRAADTLFTSVVFRPYCPDSNTRKMYWDDIILSLTPGDYPIGAGEVIGLSPDADGTHNNAGGDIQDNDSNVIDGSTHYAYTHLDSVPLSDTTDHIQQETNDDTAYVEVTFPDISASSVNGAMGVLAYYSATAAANEGACYTVDSEATETAIWGDSTTQQDYSEETVFYKSAVITEPSGTWDDAEVDALKIRLGHSGDANPDPYWVNVMIEVDYVAAGGPTYTLECDAGTYAITGAALAPKHDKKIACTAGTYAVTGAALAPKHNKKLGCVAGTYAVTGAALAPRHDKKLSCAAGTYAVTGAALAPKHHKKIACDGGTYIMTGAAASLVYTEGGAVQYGGGWHQFQRMSQN